MILIEKTNNYLKKIIFDAGHLIDEKGVLQKNKIPAHIREKEYDIIEDLSVEENFQYPVYDSQKNNIIEDQEALKERENQQKEFEKEIKIQEKIREQAIKCLKNDGEWEES